MPQYTFKDKETGQETTLQLKISEYEQYKQDNPHMQQVISDRIGFGDPARLGITKTPDSWKEVLKKAKNAHKDSTVRVR